MPILQKSKSLAKRSKTLVRQTSNSCRRKVSPNFGKKAKKACKTTAKYGIFTGGICTKCIECMPKEIKSIKYLTDVEFVHKLDKVCNGNDKLKAYCNECRHTLVVNKSNIALFSSKEFERNL